MKKFIVIIAGVFFLSFTTHKYYLALTEVEHNTKSNSIQMIMNVFMDDIELAINSEQGTDLQLTTKKEPENVDDYFYSYLKNHFTVIVNNEKATYNFIGKEYDDNIVYFYLEIENISEVNSIEIINSVLTKQFPDQQNLIKAKINNTKKSLFLTKENNKGLLNY